MNRKQSDVVLAALNYQPVGFLEDIDYLGLEDSRLREIESLNSLELSKRAEESLKIFNLLSKE